MQLSLPLDAGPDGLAYTPDFVDAREEQALLARLATLALHPVVMHGQAALRTVAHFGLRYGYESWTLDDAPPLPAWLAPLAARVAPGMSARPDEVAEVLVTRYPAGARIGWHRDAPLFGPAVAALSLGAPARLLLRRRRAGGFDRYALEVAPRSLYVLAGAARAAWQHATAPVAAERWSITFRTLAAPGRAPTRAVLRRAGDAPRRSRPRARRRAPRAAP